MAVTADVPQLEQLKSMPPLTHSSSARAREKEAGRLLALHCPLISICPPDTAGTKLLQ